MSTKRFTKTALAALLFCQIPCVSMAYESGVIINGQPLSYAEKAALEYQIGVQILPGRYVMDGNCWKNLTLGTSGCLGSGTINTFSRYGSGEYNGKGDWSYRSDLPGGSVGGTSDGCLYTSFGWSNC